jgi:hypothetical protein
MNKLFLTTAVALTLAAGPACAQQVKQSQGADTPVLTTGVLTTGDQASDYGPRQPQPPGDPKSFPHMADGHPDFSGIWYAGTRDLLDTMDFAVPIPLTPAYQAVRAKRIAATRQGNPYADFVSTCEAFGMPRVMSYGNLEFVQRPNELYVITEALHEVRRIYMDGKKHGEYQDPAFDGISTGHWDGGTLVVDTGDLRAGYLDMAGAPHSDQLRITERLHLVNKDQLQNDLTITDPVALTKPLQVTIRYDRRPADFEIDEYICTENYRSGGGIGLTGPTSPQGMLPASANSNQ